MTIDRIGVIRVLSSDDQAFLDMHQELMKQVVANKTWQTKALWDQPNGIHDEVTLAQALPKIFQLGSLWSADIDLLVVSCAADPGVETLRQTLPIPVIGAGESCCTVAKRYGTNIGVLGLEPQAPAVFDRELADCHLIYRQPRHVQCTHDIHTPAGQASIIEAALECEALGAQVIALACTGMATVDVAALLAPHTSLPVINPVIAAGMCIAAS
ncbi:aspartate/glutamate racemase family protein [Vibrio porteresiae]|uniref:Aspartate/glutamate racemase family protein n=1 Tax=Vibrio porteresiae DSM 19223 TaxID=1123496 RepID=A0ABZ0QI84_9VIBR|nr:aspartate/glutamate racemase family protein [Vibrio porteresiae]WPC76150.1 aspartate/glutamate racemase family protein [Vibrio porteresiae DSM 19223]